MFTVLCTVNSQRFQHSFRTLEQAELYAAVSRGNFPGGVFEVI